MTWYTDNATFDTVLLGSYIYVAFVIVAAQFFKAPYGRFSSDQYGLSLSPRLGWFLMELPATISFLYFYFQGENRFETVPLVFLAIWLIHYGNRGFIFPFLIRTAKGEKGSFSITIILSGWLMTTMHGYLNATFFSELGKLRSKEEIESGEKVYRIPQGGMFRYVTNAQYTTELISWTGFAIMTWSPAALFVLTISAANLVPRAFQSHQWYLDKFPDYPKNRKVIIPWVL